MSLRALEAERLLDGPLRRLEGAALQGVRQPSWDRVLLNLRIPGETVLLDLVATPTMARFHRSEKAPPNPAKPFAFQGLLRARLRGTLDGLRLLGGDRVLELKFGELRLMLVFAGSRTDLLLLDSRDEVLGSLRQSLAVGDRFEWSPRSAANVVDRFVEIPDEALNEAVRSFYEERERVLARSRADAVLRSYRKRLLRRIEKQRQESARGEQATSLRARADLLKGSFHLLQRGADQVEVHDWSSGKDVIIDLDPSLSPADNLERLYRRAAKAQRPGEQAAARLAKSERLLKELDSGQAAPALATSGQTLPSHQGKLTRGQKRRTQKTGRLPYLSYRTPSGLEIRVGRGASQNDELTFKHTRGNDVWLHVRGRPGAHVVVCRPGKAPQPALLLLAAQLAMKHSGLKDGARAEVSWTRAKEVRKPKGLAPGKVLLRSEKVLFVELDSASLEQLQRC